MVARAHTSFCSTGGNCWCKVVENPVPDPSLGREGNTQPVVTDSSGVDKTTPQEQGSRLVAVDEVTFDDLPDAPFPNPPYSKLPVGEYYVGDRVRVHTDKAVPQSNHYNLIGEQGIIRAFMGQGKLAILFFDNHKVFGKGHEAAVPVEWFTKVTS